LEDCVAKNKKAGAGPLSDPGVLACIQKNADLGKSIDSSVAANVKEWAEREKRTKAASGARPTAASEVAAAEARITAAPATSPAVPTVRKITDAEFAQVASGMRLEEVFHLLGKPYSRIEGDSLQLKYQLESGKYGRITLENRVVTGVRIAD
jgi:hypothetical protein